MRQKGSLPCRQIVVINDASHAVIRDGFQIMSLPLVLFPLLFVLDRVLADKVGAEHILQCVQTEIVHQVIVLHDTKNSECRVLPLAHHALELMQAQHENRNKVSPLVFPSPRNPMQPWESRGAWLWEVLQMMAILAMREH